MNNLFNFTLYCLSQIKHDLYGIPTTSTGFKSFFHLLLGESKPVCYERLDINFAATDKLNTERPCVLVAENTNHINLPASHCYISDKKTNTQSPLRDWIEVKGKKLS